MQSTQDFMGSWDPVGAGSLLLPVLPGAGSTTGVATGSSLIFLALGQLTPFSTRASRRAHGFEQSNE